MIEHLKHPVFKVVSETAEKLGTEAYVIGGFVRDIFLHRRSKDVDIVTVGSGIRLAEEVAKAVGAKKPRVFKNFGTAMLHYKDWEIEFVGARKESYRKNSRKPIVEDGSLQDDQNRRDFTINALALSLNKENYGELLDPFNGIQDLHDSLIRTPLEPGRTFSDDPLRMMRAIRFATQLQFEIHPETFEALRENAHRIKIVSMERVADELQKIMASPKPSIGFDLMFKSGLLQIILPEVYEMYGTEYVDGRGHKDNLYHSLEVLDNVAGKSDNIWLRWAALVHDIGKPVTKKFESEQGWTFHSHDFIGARMVPKMFRRLKLPMNEKMRFVQKLVQLHLRPIALTEENVTDSAIRRLLFDAGDDLEELMTLCEADITSKNPKKVRRYRNNFKMVRRKLKEVEAKDRIRNWEPPISGEIIMKVFDITPGREVGDIKGAIREAILDGEVQNDFRDALNFMKEKGKEMGLKPVKDIDDFEQEEKEWHQRQDLRQLPEQKENNE